MNDKLRSMINDYLKEDGYVDIADLDEDLMDDSFDEDFDEEEEIDTVIQDITNLYNESDEKTQAIIDILIEEEDGIETLVNSMYGLEEEELDEGMIGDVKTFIKKKIAGPTPAERQQKNRDVLNKHFAKQSKGFNDIIAKERAKERAKKANEETEEISELSKDVLARYAKKAAVNIRTKSNIHHGYEDIKADITKVIVKNSPYSSPHSEHDRDPYALKQASKEHEVISDMIKLNQHKQNNRIEGIGRASVKLSKATAPKSKNPGPTIDQPSKTGNEKPTVSTTKTTKH